MKKTEGYIVKELEDEYIVLPVGERTEEVNEVISLSETAGFIYIHADQAEDIEELAQLVGNEYGIEASEVYEDVKNAVKTFREKEFFCEPKSLAFGRSGEKMQLNENRKDEPAASKATQRTENDKKDSVRKSPVHCVQKLQVFR